MHTRMSLRISMSLFAFISLASCTPPHPTHPTRIECKVQVETMFSGRFDTTSPGTIRATEDPCDGPGIPSTSWTERGVSSVSICAAAGTTADQASSLCSNYLGRTSEVAAAPLTPTLSGRGRLCPGSLTPLSSRFLGTSGTPPTLHPNDCLEGTRLPLVP
jgi:hypothetical protein